MVNDAKHKTGTEHKSLDVHSGGTRAARVFAGSQQRLESHRILYEAGQ